MDGEEERETEREAYFKTSKFPVSAAALHVLESHSHPSSLLHQHYSFYIKQKSKIMKKKNKKFVTLSISICSHVLPVQRRSTPLMQMHTFIN